MELVTSEEMRDLDRRANDELGMPGLLLMENAGSAVARVGIRLATQMGWNRLHAVCGAGNNGGDGMAAVRHLLAAGFTVTYELCGDPSRVRGDAAVQLRLLQALGVTPTAEMPRGDAVLIDAILGTGAAGPIRPNVGRTIDAINDSRCPVVSVDLPSGVDANTGATAGPAVRADETVTLGLAKPGLFLHPGAALVGRLIVDPIGLDWSALSRPDTLRCYTTEHAQTHLPPRRSNAHKGDFGHVLVLGGSAGMSGAAALTGRAAIGSGAGLVTVGVPLGVQSVVAGHDPDYMTIGLPEMDGCLSEAAAEAIRPWLARAKVVCLGPGLGSGGSAHAFVRRFVAECPLPIVLDADGLNAIAGRPSLTRGRDAATVFTPHPGECGRMLGVDTALIQADRIGAARRLASEYGGVGLLKGAGTVVANGPVEPEHATIITTGNPGMATGGSGDVLTGVVGSLMAQGLAPYDAACLGAHIHGCAGDLAREALGCHGVSASAICDRLPGAMKELSR